MDTRPRELNDQPLSQVNDGHEGLASQLPVEILRYINQQYPEPEFPRLYSLSKSISPSGAVWQLEAFKDRIGSYDVNWPDIFTGQPSSDLSELLTQEQYKAAEKLYDRQRDGTVQKFVDGQDRAVVSVENQSVPLEGFSGAMYFKALVERALAIELATKQLISETDDPKVKDLWQQSLQSSVLNGLFRSLSQGEKRGEFVSDFLNLAAQIGAKLGIDPQVLESYYTEQINQVLTSNSPRALGALGALEVADIGNFPVELGALEIAAATIRELEDTASKRILDDTFTSVLTTFMSQTEGAIEDEVPTLERIITSSLEAVGGILPEKVEVIGQFMERCDEDERHTRLIQAMLDKIDTDKGRHLTSVFGASARSEEEITKRLNRAGALVVKYGDREQLERWVTAVGKSYAGERGYTTGPLRRHVESLLDMEGVDNDRALAVLVEINKSGLCDKRADAAFFNKIMEAAAQVFESRNLDQGLTTGEHLLLTEVWKVGKAPFSLGTLKLLIWDYYSVLAIFEHYRDSVAGLLEATDSELVDWQYTIINELLENRKQNWEDLHLMSDQVAVEVAACYEQLASAEDSAAQLARYVRQLQEVKQRQDPILFRKLLKAGAERLVRDFGRVVEGSLSLISSDVSILLLANNWLYLYIFLASEEGITDDLNRKQITGLIRFWKILRNKPEIFNQEDRALLTTLIDEVSDWVESIEEVSTE